MGWPGYERYIPPGLLRPDGRVQRSGKAPKVPAYADTLGFQCRALGLPEPEAEVYFAKPRRWRFDFLWRQHMVALEVQGGLWTNGRHTRGAALLREHDKLNAAAALGYRVTFTTPKQLVSGEVFAWLEPILRGGSKGW